MKTWLEQRYFRVDAPLGEVGAGLDRLVGDLGLDFWACGLLVAPCNRHGKPVPGVEPAAIASYPEPWVERYISQGYLVLDPVCELTLRSNRPFFWGQDRSFLRAFRSRQKRVFEEARSFGIDSGLAIPVYGADGSVGCVCFVAADSRRLPDAVCEEQALLLTAAFDAHDALLGKVLAARSSEPVGSAGNGGAQTGADWREVLPGGASDSLHPAASEPFLFPLRRPTGGGPERQCLTVREKECLSWTLEGLTAERIAERLCLSVHTVNRHASNAARKLGCTNKHHAAVRALRAGVV